jgi:hypothetical protein
VITNKRSWATKNLFVLLGVSGLLIGFLATIFLPLPVTGKSYEFLIVSIIFILWGSGGLVVIIRRELPQLILIKGNLAVLYGIVMMVFCWVVAFMFLVMAVAKFLAGG